MRRHILLLQAAAILLMTVLAPSCRNDMGEVVVGSGTRYVNNAGGRQTVNLPDGSRVVLMDGTTIIVSKGFGKEDRDVEIDGQGLFVVRASGGMGDMGARPFMVHTGNLLIQVGGWGARFAVEAVRKQPGEEADLLDGKLRVTKSYHSDTDNEPEELGAGDMVMINREIDLMEKEKMTGPEEDKVKEKYNVVRH
jgi:transmembrane sensor